MKYFIFRRQVDITSSRESIAFNVLQNSYHENAPLRIEAENLEQAAEKAADFLLTAGFATHNPEGLGEALYFVGRANGDGTARCDSTFLIHEFLPVTKR